jgi:hypothetical protein
LLIAKKSTNSATSTNAANKDHMSGEPMVCMTAFDMNFCEPVHPRRMTIGTAHIAARNAYEFRPERHSLKAD